MHTLLKYFGLALIVGIAAVYVFGRVFAERPVWQSRAVTIVVGVVVLLWFLLWLWLWP